MNNEHLVEIELESMAHGGQALGHSAGKVMFCAGALPGEVVHARVVQDRKRWARLELLEVLRPSPQRVEPPCPYFGACGGCQWQYAAYPAQLEYKRAIVVDQLQRLGGIPRPPVLPTRGMADPWAYRNHAQFAVDARGELGFQAAHSHQIVPIAHCPLLHPLLDELHAALDVDWPDLHRLSLRAGIRTGERMVILEMTGKDVPEIETELPVSLILRTGGSDVVLIGDGAIYELLAERRYRISASSFFQVNTPQAETLVQAVRRYLEPEPDDVVLDLYCGVGTFGLALAADVARVIGVEEHPVAIADARANAGDDAALYLQGRAEAVLPGLDARITKAVLDPPRRGCRPAAMHALLALQPERIAYVSCDPATLARDAAALTGGGYHLVEVQPVDLFPQTYHVESVSLWRRAS